MNKFLRVLMLPVVLSCGVAVLPGCGGGNSGFINSPSRFAGTYSGTFSGATTQNSPQPGVPVSGTFVAVSDRNGNLTGTLSQPGVGVFPLSGTIDSDGRLSATAAVGTNQLATLRGTAVKSSNGYTLSGTFTTDFGTTTVVSGTVAGTRTSVSTTSNAKKS